MSGMLVLTRRPGEDVLIGKIGQIIEVRVLGVQGNQVRLGFVADKNIPVNRREVAERIHAENCQETVTEPEVSREGNPSPSGTLHVKKWFGRRRRSDTVDGNR